MAMTMLSQQSDTYLSSSSDAIDHLRCQAIRSPFNSCKILQHIDSVKEFLEETRRFQIAPITIEIHPTNRCNLRCRDCTFQDIDRTKEIDPVTLDRAVREIITLKKVKAIVWSGGGEPTLSRGLVSSAELVGQANIQQGIATNGTHITDELADAAVRWFTYVRVSLNAASAQTYLEMHAADRFCALKANIERLKWKRDRARGCKLTLGSSFLVYPENYQDVPAAIKNANDMGLDYLQIKPAVLSRQGKSYGFLQDAYHVLSSLQLDQYKTRVLIETEKFQDLGSCSYGRDYSTCWGALFYATIAADGEVYACCHKIGDRNCSYGNLADETFQNIWLSDRKRDVLQSIDVSYCPPNCKLHKMNKVLQEIYNSQFAEHKNFL